jgi:hypothetical protein
VTINLFVQEDRSPSGTGRAQFQTHTSEPDTTATGTANMMVDPTNYRPPILAGQSERPLLAPSPQRVADRCDDREDSPRRAYDSPDDDWHGSATNTGQPGATPIQHRRDAGHEQDRHRNDADHESNPQGFVATARVPERGEGHDPSGEGKYDEDRYEYDRSPGATKGRI